MAKDLFLTMNCEGEIEISGRGMLVASLHYVWMPQSIADGRIN